MQPVWIIWCRRIASASAEYVLLESHQMHIKARYNVWLGATTPPNLKDLNICGVFFQGYLLELVEGIQKEATCLKSSPIL